MEVSSFLLVGAAALAGGLWGARRSTRSRQLAYISGYDFHHSIRRKFNDKWPDLTPTQVDQVFEGLRQYFRICHQARRRCVAMPSLIVDDAWHAFILFTRTYKAFCDRALGRFLHHTPAEAMRSATDAQDGIKRAWRLACADEGQHPARPTRLPLLFAIDGVLDVPYGYKYSLNCGLGSARTASDAYCAGHIGCASGCAGDAGVAAAGGGCIGGGSGADSGCSGGCGGD